MTLMACRYRANLHIGDLHLTTEQLQEELDRERDREREREREQGVEAERDRDSW